MQENIDYNKYIQLIMTIKEAARCLQIIQINVGRSLTAISELRGYCTKRKVNIACIQELTIRYDKLVSRQYALVFFMAKTQWLES
jgi:hypothetical protein